MILGVTASCLLSCSSDDDGGIATNEQNKPDSPEDNLPEESKVFVGYWDDESTTTKAVDFLFFTDGTGRIYGNYNNTINEGYWTFNANTAILATTMNNWQFQVTLSNNEAWSGVSLGTTTAKTYRRGANLDMARALIRESSWKADDLTLIVSGDSKPSGTVLPELIGSRRYKNITLLEDDNTDDYTFKYEINGEYLTSYRGEEYYRSYEAGTGTIAIENPYSPSKTRIVLTGFLNGTMNKVVE